jgi:hypothetical protein
LITDKDIKEVLSISTSLLEIPTTVLPSKEDANGVLNIIGNVAEGNLEFMESFSHLSPMRASSLMMFAVDPQLQGHFAKSRNLAFLVLIFKKCEILRFHDLIAEIGIAKIRIPILAIHPDRDPNFSDPNFSDPNFRDPNFRDSHTLLTQ